MVTENALIKIPAFHYRGFEIPALKIPDPPIADLGTYEQAYKLAPKSAPLVWKVGLYHVGMGLSLGDKDAESLPEPVKQAGRLVYADAQEKLGRGVWHKDGALFVPKSETPKGMWQMSDPWSLVRYFSNIKGFKEGGKEGYDIDPLPETREEYVWLPEGGGQFTVPTGYGPHHPVTGTPLETVESKDEALKRWMGAGLTEEQANKELSRFYRRNTPGLAAVNSWSNVLGGPLCVDIYDEPRSRYPIFGSFPGVVQPSGARRRGYER